MHITLPFRSRILIPLLKCLVENEEAKDVFGHGVIKLEIILYPESLAAKVLWMIPVARYNYAATKLLGLLFIGMGFQTDEDYWRRQTAWTNYPFS